MLIGNPPGHSMGGPPPHWGNNYERGRRDEDGYNGGGGGRRQNWGRGRGRMWRPERTPVQCTLYSSLFKIEGEGSTP